MAFQHYNLSPGNIHGIVNWEFADLAARDAQVVTEQDLNKVCKVGVGTLFWLSSISPVTWSEMDGSGVLKSIRAAVSFDSDGTINLGSVLPTNIIVSRILVSTLQAFDGSPTVTFGVSGQIDELGLSNESDLTTTGVYIIDCFKTYSTNEQLIATYISGGATTGLASVEVHYSLV